MGRIGSMRESRGTKKLYHFAIFAIINELLIIKNRHISSANAPTV